jgi:hypothetical protein
MSHAYPLIPYEEPAALALASISNFLLSFLFKPANSPCFPFAAQSFFLASNFAVARLAFSSRFFTCSFVTLASVEAYRQVVDPSIDLSMAMKREVLVMEQEEKTHTFLDPLISLRHSRTISRGSNPSKSIPSFSTS